MVMVSDNAAILDNDLTQLQPQLQPSTPMHDSASTRAERLPSRQQITAFIGIDISKLTFDVSLRFDMEDKERKSHQFKNTLAGMAEFDVWVAKQLHKRDNKAYHACCEATGIYYELLANHIHAQSQTKGHLISVLNPVVIRRYAECQMTRSKTDKLDANTIARYCQRERPQAWDAPKPSEHALQQMTRQLEHLKQHLASERVRLQSAHSSVQNSVEQTIKGLDEQVVLMQKAIDEHIKSDDDLSGDHKLLQSVAGIGPVLSQVLLSVSRGGRRFEKAKQLAAFAGLAPSEHSSGSSVKRRVKISKQGDSNLRRILYMPAVSMYGKRGVYKAFIERLEASGKNKMQILVALMRKILTIAQAVLKSKVAFDPKLHAN